MSEHWKQLQDRAQNEGKTSYQLLDEIDKRNKTKNLDKESSKPSNPISYSKSGRKSPQHKAFSKPPRYNLRRKSPPPPALTMEQLEKNNTNTDKRSRNISPPVNSISPPVNSISPQHNTMYNETIQHIIDTIKILVYQNRALICGPFNLQDIRKIKLDLPQYIDILINGKNMRDFMYNLSQFLKTTISSYKVEHISRGNIKNIIEQTHDLQNYSSTHDGTEIYVHIVKISNPESQLVCEIRFIILDNEKTKTVKDYIIPLHIPEGLYCAEHLHLTNDGLDRYNIDYSSSPLDYIMNNYESKIISLMPKINDFDYTKIAQYMKKIINTNYESPYSYEFDIFNTMPMHKKSDFWLCNKEIKDSDSCCTKCTIGLKGFTQNSYNRYVITKCCKKKYHIECMEMNYYPLFEAMHLYSYLLCDCGYTNIDEYSCNSRLLLALYKNYY